MSYRSLDDVFNNSEWLFYTIGYAITRVTDNVGWWLGIIEFLVICPFTIGAWKLRKRLPATFLIALFYFKFYNYSLCTVSYTHLDVYKRQFQLLCQCIMWKNTLVNVWTAFLHKLIRILRLF